MKKLTRALHSVGEDALRVRTLGVDFLPDEDNEYNFGSSNYRWNNFFMKGYWRNWEPIEQVRLTPANEDRIYWEYASTPSPAKGFRVYNDTKEEELFSVDLNKNIRPSLTFADSIATQDVIPREDGKYNLGKSGKKYHKIYADTIVGDMVGDEWEINDNMYIHPQGNFLRVYEASYFDLKNVPIKDTADSEVSIAVNHQLSMEGDKIVNVQQGTAASEVVTAERTLTGGNAIDPIGDLTQDRTIDVSQNGIETYEINEAISPTWTSAHTFNAGITMGADLDLSNFNLLNADSINPNGGLLNVGSDVDLLTNLLNIDKDKLIIDATTVTTTASELNILDGATLNTDEINQLDGNNLIHDLNLSGYEIFDNADFIVSISAGHILDLQGDKITGVQQATATSEVVTGGRTLTGGNAIDAIGDLTQDRTINVSTDGIKEDELDLSITPTWTSRHDFGAGITVDQGEMVIDATTMTASADELNIMDGATLSTPEINQLDGNDLIHDLNLNGYEIRDDADSEVSAASAHTFRLGNDLIALDGEVIWDESAGYIPQPRLENDSITLTGGNAIDAIGTISLGGADTIAVSSNAIQVDELDESIAPTWTGLHTFDAGWELGDSANAGGNYIYALPKIQNLGGNIDIDADSITTFPVMNVPLDMGSNKVTNIAQATDVDDAVAAGRTLNAGSGLSGTGDLTSDVTFDVNVGNALEIVSDTVQVASNSIQTDEIDESIAPTWDGLHTFASSVDVSGGDLQIYDDLKQFFGSDEDYSVRYDTGEGKVVIRDEAAGKDLCYIL